MKVKKVKAEEVKLGEDVMESPRKVIRIEITELGKRRFKFDTGKSAILNDGDEVEVLVE
jgi:hypothetical protein